MKKYTDNGALLNYIKQNNLRDIQEELLNTLFFVTGNKEEMEKAFAYAEQHSSFSFDKHIDLPIPETTDLKVIYAREKMNMIKNFSRERYQKILDIHNQIYIPEPSTEDANDEDTFLKTKKIITIVIFILILGALISYIILKNN